LRSNIQDCQWLKCKNNELHEFLLITRIKMADLLYKEESYRIIGSCMKVHSELGADFVLSVSEWIDQNKRTNLIICFLETLI